MVKPGEGQAVTKVIGCGTRSRPKEQAVTTCIPKVEPGKQSPGAMTKDSVCQIEFESTEREREERTFYRLQLCFFPHQQTRQVVTLRPELCPSHAQTPKPQNVTADFTHCQSPFVFSSAQALQLGVHNITFISWLHVLIRLPMRCFLYKFNISNWNHLLKRGNWMYTT